MSLPKMELATYDLRLETEKSTTDPDFIGRTQPSLT